MTLAHRLAQQGKKVTLYEAAPYLGGVASAWTLGDIVWDRHYHVILLSDQFLRSILNELNLEGDLQWVETRTGFYTDSKLYSMSNAIEFLKFPPLGLIDKFRLGATIFYASRVKNWRKLENILVADWLARWSGKRTFTKIWLPLLKAKLGDNYKKASAAFIWAIIARMYAARRAGMKKEMFGYVPGGYARILKEFGELLIRDQVCIELGQSVTKVSGDDTDKVLVELADGRRRQFDQVAITAPAPVAARVCQGLSAAETNLLNGIEYQGIICASLLLSEPLATFYITNITDPWVPFTGVIEMSALVDRKQFNGNTLIYLPKYVACDSTDFDIPDEILKERFLGALERMYPNFNRRTLLSFKVSRVRYLLPISTLNYSQRVPPVATSIRGVHLVNSAHIVNGTLNVNETILVAERAAAQFALESAMNYSSRGESDTQVYEGDRKSVV